ncbi:hypothetical protein B0J13DRAFT_506928 [Dactylonectria estremocensis]|uniref:Rhodopsin domain-containing protein n=1 Tax=Dactylonectria estremocensis TaxID=1079267 RepID=A0A9P9EH75_9HYPO|nr:hypothetical protein B0J13DRAFT_506928 [Dactylonectria estremocensis]
MDQEAPLVDDSIGLTSLAIVGSIFAISIVLYMLRIYVRVIPRYKLNGSDYCASCALVAEAITFSFFASATASGLGCHSFFISPEDGALILRCLFAIAVVGLWASTLARISIAYLLLSLSTCCRSARVVLWSMIALQIGALIVTEAITLLQCRPIQAIWKDIPEAQCLSIKTLQVGGYLYTEVLTGVKIKGVSIAGDLVFAIMPITLIWNLNRSVLERCLISFLLASGLFATAAAATRLFYIRTLNYNSSDVFREIMPTFFWCRIEEVTLIAASSLPFLKIATEDILCKLGFPGFRYIERALQAYHSRSPSGKDCGSKFPVRNQSICELIDNNCDLEAGRTTSCATARSCR